MPKSTSPRTQKQKSKHAATPLPAQPFPAQHALAHVGAWVHSPEQSIRIPDHSDQGIRHTTQCDDFPVLDNKCSNNPHRSTKHPLHTHQALDTHTPTQSHDHTTRSFEPRSFTQQDRPHARPGTRTSEQIEDTFLVSHRQEYSIGRWQAERMEDAPWNDIACLQATSDGRGGERLRRRRETK